MTKRDVIKCLKHYRWIDEEIADIERFDPKNKKRLRANKKFKNDITTALNELSREERVALVEHYVHGYQWERVRRIYPVSERTARNYAERGLLSMAQKLKNNKTIRRFLARGYIKGE